MKSIMGVWGVFLLLLAAISGCNEQKLPSSDVAEPQRIPIEDDIEYFPPGPEFQLSREAARQKAEAAKRNEEELAAAEATPPRSKVVPAAPRRRTVFDSLYEAVRNGAAEALSEEAPAP